MENQPAFRAQTVGSGAAWKSVGRASRRWEQCRRVAADSWHAGFEKYVEQVRLIDRVFRRRGIAMSQA